MHTLARSVAALVAAAIPSIAWAQSAPLNANQQLAHDVYKQLIEINTVDSVGSVTKAVDAMVERFREAGFPEADIHVFTRPDHPTKSNLVVRYRGNGTGTGKPIMLLAHLDVVAALRSDWSLDPFTFTEKDGYYYGRGTSDDKDMASIFVANMLLDKKAGWVPKRDLILALTADEEGGDANGAEWLATTQRDLIDAAYAINEGGGGVLRDGKPVTNSVQAAEKVSVNFTITATNRGGHSSIPRPDNAIYELSRALQKLSAYHFPIQLNPVSKAFFEQTNSLEEPAMGTAIRRLLADPANASANAVVSANPRYSSILRTTCVATRLAGGHAYNALPQIASANINCRIVPTSSPAETRDMLARVIADTGIKITETVPIRDKGRAAPSPLTPELMTAVTDITHDMFGAKVVIVPEMSTGATDGRYMRAAGIPTYGVSGLFDDPNDSRIHGRDERMPIKWYYEGQEFLHRLVHRLADGK